LIIIHFVDHYTFCFQAAAAGALTPASKIGYAKEHIARAKAHVAACDFASGLMEYQKGIELMPTFFLKKFNFHFFSPLLFN
jgi:hypothetical protein